MLKLQWLILFACLATVVNSRRCPAVRYPLVSIPPGTINSYCMQAQSCGGRDKCPVGQVCCDISPCGRKCVFDVCRDCARGEECVYTFVNCFAYPCPPDVSCRDPNADVCALPQKVGPCRAAINRWFYNTATQNCELFSWGGCDPNGNNFATEEECNQQCDVCALPQKVGPCRAAINRWFYNTVTQNCELFSWGGCQPNGNNFEAQEECNAQCVCPAPIPWPQDSLRPIVFNCGSDPDNPTCSGKNEVCCETVQGFEWNCVGVSTRRRKRAAPDRLCKPNPCPKGFRCEESNACGRLPGPCAKCTPKLRGVPPHCDKKNPCAREKCTDGKECVALTVVTCVECLDPENYSPCCGCYNTTVGTCEDVGAVRRKRAAPTNLCQTQPCSPGYRCEESDNCGGVSPCIRCIPNEGQGGGPPANCRFDRTPNNPCAGKQCNDGEKCEVFRALLCTLCLPDYYDPKCCGCFDTAWASCVEDVCAGYNCPPATHCEESTCGELDEPCPVCEPNGGGGGNGRRKRSAKGKSGKKVCPPPAGEVGTCDQLCSSNGDCPGKKLCCSNGCGYSCQNGVNSVCQGYNCPEGQTCIEYTLRCLIPPCDVVPQCVPEEGRRKRSAKGKNKLVCPEPGIGICVELCSSDSQCEENQLCCSNGCGNVCMDGVSKGNNGGGNNGKGRKKRASDPCSLPSEPGLCKGSFPRWYYDSKTGKCEKFVYGGCGGNANNFETEADCLNQCSGPGNGGGNNGGGNNGGGNNGGNNGKGKGRKKRAAGASD